MATPVKELKGVTDAIAAALAAKDIKDNDALVSAAASAEQRKALAADCGCEVRDLLELANRADLARIKGVSGVYSDLLERAGVDTVKELATPREGDADRRLDRRPRAAGAVLQQPPGATAQPQPRPGPGTTPACPSVVLRRNRMGHYVARGSINGAPVTFLLDTGATAVALPLDAGAG
jgi:predicted flap endonuclease-1-like 5' DNA nuclease